jgi:hypothetical protein
MWSELTRLTHPAGRARLPPPVTRAPGEPASDRQLAGQAKPAARSELLRPAPTGPPLLLSPEAARQLRPGDRRRPPRPHRPQARPRRLRRRWLPQHGARRRPRLHRRSRRRCLRSRRSYLHLRPRSACRRLRRCLRSRRSCRPFRLCPHCRRSSRRSCRICLVPRTSSSGARAPMVVVSLFAAQMSPHETSHRRHRRRPRSCLRPRRSRSHWRAAGSHPADAGRAQRDGGRHGPRPTGCTGRGGAEPEARAACSAPRRAASSPARAARPVAATCALRPVARTRDEACLRRAGAQRAPSFPSAAARADASRGDASASRSGTSASDTSAGEPSAGLTAAAATTNATCRGADRSACSAAVLRSAP